jgi:hypothetical protein
MVRAAGFSMQIAPAKTAPIARQAAAFIARSHSSATDFDICDQRHPVRDRSLEDGFMKTRSRCGASA